MWPAFWMLPQVGGEAVLLASLRAQRDAALRALLCAPHPTAGAPPPPPRNVC